MCAFNLDLLNVAINILNIETHVLVTTACSSYDLNFFIGSNYEAFVPNDEISRNVVKSIEINEINLIALKFLITDQ